MTRRKEPVLHTVLRHLFTGADNKSWDIGRFLWALAFLVAVILTFHGHVIGRPFDIQGFGIGIGTLLACGGAALKLKEGSEPPAATNPADPPH